MTITIINKIKKLLVLLILVFPIYTLNSYSSVVKEIESTCFLYSNKIQEVFNFPKKVSHIIVNESFKNGLNPFLISSIIYKESRGRQYARGIPLLIRYKGKYIVRQRAVGYMQLLPIYHAKGIPRKKLYDPNINISRGSKYFRKCLDMANGNLTIALKNYNSGPSSDTYNWKYINEISDRFENLTGGLDPFLELYGDILI